MKKQALTFILICFLVFAAGAIFWAERKFDSVPISQIREATPVPKVIFATTPNPTPSPVHDALTTAYGKFQTGDYEGAVYALRLELTRAPDDAFLKKNLATALFALGILRLQQNNLSEAENLFEEAAKLGHFDSEQVLAAIKIRAGQLDTASNIFEDMYKKSKDRGILKLMTEMALGQDDLPRAEQMLYRLQESVLADAQASQDDKDFIEKQSKRLELKQNFARNEELVDLGNIQVAYSSPEYKAQAKVVASALERVAEELSFYLGPFPSTTRLRAYLYPADSFQNSNAAPPWAGAFFDGYIRIPVRKGSLSAQMTENLIRLSRHEATHAYFYAHCGDVLPSWIGEGLAQRFEKKSLQNELTSFRMSFGLSAARTTPSSSLDGAFTSAPNSEVGELYKRSFILAEVLALENNGHGIWRDFFQAVCTNRVSVGQALNERFGAPSAVSIWQKYSEKIASRMR